MTYESTPLSSLAQKHAATCFLNSFLREWDQQEVQNDNLEQAIHVSLSPQIKLVLPLKKYSLLGRHQYLGTYYVKTPEQSFEVDFYEMVHILSETLQVSQSLEADIVQKFKSRVHASTNLIKKTIAYRYEELLNLPEEELDFIAAEQALFVGHNFHPNPKSRDEFSDEDMQTYSPELKGSFALKWLLVSQDILYVESSKNWQKHKCMSEILNALGYSIDVPPGFGLYPAHPWQYEILKQNKTIQTYIQQGLIRSLSIANPKSWFPTSSLRSIYNKNSPYMLKYSMSLRLTNSTRHLLKHEVERGLQIDDVLSLAEVKSDLKERFGNKFQVITEPSYIGLKDENGKLLDASILCLRTNPFKDLASSENALVLSTLVQDGINLPEKNLALSLLHKHKEKHQKDLRDLCFKWFENYLQIVVRPLLEIQGDLGIMFGAHQQNLILKLKEGLPVKAYFRDCQGSGYTHFGYSRFASKVTSIKEDNGNVLPQKMSHSLFCYYLIINSTFNVICALAAQEDVSENELVLVLRNFLVNLKQTAQLKDNSCIDYLLNDKKIMHKGNFMCSLQSLNENTTKDPLSVYTPIANPLFQNLKGD